MASGDIALCHLRCYQVTFERVMPLFSLYLSPPLSLSLSLSVSPLSLSLSLSHSLSLSLSLSFYISPPPLSLSPSLSLFLSFSLSPSLSLSLSEIKHLLRYILLLFCILITSYRLFICCLSRDATDCPLVSVSDIVVVYTSDHFHFRLSSSFLTSIFRFITLRYTCCRFSFFFTRTFHHRIIPSFFITTISVSCGLLCQCVRFWGR